MHWRKGPTIFILFIYIFICLLIHFLKDPPFLKLILAERSVFDGCDIELWMPSQFIGFMVESNIFLLMQTDAFNILNKLFALSSFFISTTVLFHCFTLLLPAMNRHISLVPVL